MQELAKQARFEVLHKQQETCPVYFGLRNPKLVSDLKSDLESKSYDGVLICNRWTIQLYGHYLSY